MSVPKNNERVVVTEVLRDSDETFRQGHRDIEHRKHESWSSCSFGEHTLLSKSFNIATHRLSLDLDAE